MTAISSPVRVVVTPLIVDVERRTRQEAEERIRSAMEKLAEADYDLRVVAPYPSSFNMGRTEYLAKLARRKFYEAITIGDKNRNPISRSVNSPDYRVAASNKIDAFIEQAVALSKQTYEAFILKLEMKIGEHLTATLEGNHVWGDSFITVEKANGEKERWRTHSILNISTLGLYFNQFPTRKIKMKLFSERR